MHLKDQTTSLLVLGGKTSVPFDGAIVYINSSLHLGRKYSRIFVRGHYLLREANSFRRAQLEENYELRGTDNVQGQIPENIFAPNGGFHVYYPSNIFRNASCFDNWGIFSDIPQF